MDSKTYTIFVDRAVPISELKERIASVTGVVSEQQRLICRGRVFQDDQLLSAFSVEDGHTLHLVVRQPIAPLSESLSSDAGDDPVLSAGYSQGIQQPLIVVRVNTARQADGAYSDLGQNVSAALGSLGISIAEGGIEEIDALGSLHERLFSSSVPSTVRPNGVDQTSSPLASAQPAAISDSLTTLSEFAANGINVNNMQISENSMGNVQDFGQIRLPRPSLLGEVLQSRRHLIRDVAYRLSNLSRQLEDHVNSTYPSSRSVCQSNLDQSGSVLENLGSSLMDLGRAIFMFRSGEPPLGTNMGSLQEGTTHSSPFAGQSVASPSRNSEIRIGTGDISSPPGGRGLSDFRDRVNQFLRVVSRRGHVQVATETNEAVADAQVEPEAGMDEGIFVSNIIQQEEEDPSWIFKTPSPPESKRKKSE